MPVGYRIGMVAGEEVEDDHRQAETLVVLGTIGVVPLGLRSLELGRPMLLEKARPVAGSVKPQESQSTMAMSFCRLTSTFFSLTSPMT